jgi:DNA-directed RNA polymerase subunit H (RpoH/RPB5)
MNFETIDILLRSRLTLLDHLESEGYNTTPFRKFSHKEIQEMIKSGPVNGAPPALSMLLQRREPEAAGPDDYTQCQVVYTLGRIKQKLATFVTSIVDPEETGFDFKTTEVIILTLEPIVLNFHQYAYQCWRSTVDAETGKHLKVRFFQAAAIVNNPLKHMLVPPHEKVPSSEKTELLKGLYAKERQLPYIRFHEDPVARMLGLLPGDIVKITRPSPTAGECILYRLCVP